MKGFVGDIEKLTEENGHSRRAGMKSGLICASQLPSEIAPLGRK